MSWRRGIWIGLLAGVLVLGGCATPSAGPEPAADPPAGVEIRSDAPPEYDLLVAQQLTLEGRGAEAVEAYLRAVAKDEQSAYLHRKAAVALAQHNRLERGARPRAAGRRARPGRRRLAHLPGAALPNPAPGRRGGGDPAGRRRRAAESGRGLSALSDLHGWRALRGRARRRALAGRARAGRPARPRGGGERLPAHGAAGRRRAGVCARRSSRSPETCASTARWPACCASAATTRPRSPSTTR